MTVSFVSAGRDSSASASGSQLRQLFIQFFGRVPVVPVQGDATVNRELYMSRSPDGLLPVCVALEAETEVPGEEGIVAPGRSFG